MDGGMVLSLVSSRLVSRESNSLEWCAGRAIILRTRVVSLQISFSGWVTSARERISCLSVSSSSSCQTMARTSAPPFAPLLVLLLMVSAYAADQLSEFNFSNFTSPLPGIGNTVC